MPLSETGAYVNAILDETGQHRFADLLENGQKIFGVAPVSVVQTVEVSDAQHVSDNYAKSISKRIFDALSAILADQIVSSHARIITDFAVVTETISRMTFRLTADSSPIADQSSTIISKIVADALDIADRRNINGVVRLPVADALNVADALETYRFRALTIAEAILTATCATIQIRPERWLKLYAQRNRTFADSAHPISDSADFQISGQSLERILTDAVATADSLSTSLTKRILDAQAPVLESAPQLDINLTLLFIADAMAQFGSCATIQVRPERWLKLSAERNRLETDEQRPVSEIVTTSAVQIVLRSVVDTLALSDDALKLIAKFLADAQRPLADTATTLLAGIAQLVTDALDVADSRASRLEKHVDETIAISDAAATFTARPLHDVRPADRADIVSDVSTAQLVTERAITTRTIDLSTLKPGFNIDRLSLTRTAVADFDQPGLFHTLNMASRPAYQFEIDAPTIDASAISSLQAFHRFHQSNRTFFFDGEHWGYVSTLSLIGEGDGSRTLFHLPNRHIDADSISVAIGDGATVSLTTAYSLNATPGTIVFDTAPDSGDDILASHAHQYEVIFAPDGLRVTNYDRGAYRAEIVLREAA